LLHGIPGEAANRFVVQAIHSVRPIIGARAKKVSWKPVAGFVGWAVGKRLLGHGGWSAALVELYRKIRPQWSVRLSNGIRLGGFESGTDNHENYHDFMSDPYRAYHSREVIAN
jgi:hypothetical protein